MNIASIQFPVFEPYNKSTIELYVSGCIGKCQECHNPDLWDYNYGEPLAHKTLSWLKKRSIFFDVVSILGGDLLDQDNRQAKEFIVELKECLPNKEFWLFTGYNESEIFLCYDWIFELFDYIKVGRYMPKLKQEGFPASSNQKLIKKGVDY